MSAASDELRAAVGYSKADDALLSRLEPRLASTILPRLPGLDLAALSAGRASLVEAVDGLELDAADAEAARRALHRRLDWAIAERARAAASERTERLALLGQVAGSIGHELRNPLGVIESSLYLLHARPDDAASRDKHLRRIGEQARIATQVITDLLALIDARNARPTIDDPFAPSALLDDAVALLGAHGATLTRGELAALPPVHGDRGQLRHALRNLLDNACRAAKREVRVSGRLAGDGVEILVEDDGPGVDPAVAALLFEPLYSTRQGGLGLGLALVRHIAERNGGSVRHEPLSPGARFVLALRGAR